MGEVSEPRKHHLVAQLYQRGFARKKGKSWQVRVVDRATGEGGVRSVRDVFAQRDWNTVVDEDGNKDFSVEGLLAQYIDGPAAPVLGELRRDIFPLTERHRDALALFLAAQLTRGRMPRENVAKFVVDLNRQMLRMTVANYTDEHWMRAIGEVPDEKTKRMFMDSEKHFAIRPTNALLLQTLLGPVGEVAEYVAKRTWTLVRFDEPCLFTGENPVVHIDPAGGEFGFGVATCEQMYMPISTTRALVLAHPWTSWPETVVNGTRQLAERLNWAMLNYPANHELLLHPDVAQHPLPGVALLASAESTWWPWGEDPEARPPVYLSYVAQRREVERYAA